MHLEPYKYPRIVLVCADCDKRDDGPRQFDSKTGASGLRQALRKVPVAVAVRVTRTRCLGLCPRKALAAVALGAGLPAVSAALHDEGDLDKLARAVCGTVG